MQAVIICGGKGTRIAQVAADVPKPMIRVAGKPILEWQVEALKREGFDDFFFTVGHLKNVIIDHFGDGSKLSPSTGRPFGVRIRYVEEAVPLGTAGALHHLRDFLTDDFLLLCGDIIFDVDFTRFIAAHKRFGGDATIFTHPNSHPFDSSIIEACNSRVTRWISKEEERGWTENRVNAGLHILSPSVISSLDEPCKRDLDRDILKPLVSRGRLFCYDSPEYVKDMGTPDRLFDVERDIESGRVAARNLRRKQSAVFIDRDGTINRDRGFISSPDDFELVPGAAEAIRAINSSGRLAICVTNQPVIARGECSLETLHEIHKKMTTLLGREGAFLDALYFCPHHPDKGFPSERPEYKIDCDCRKPKPGMLLQAAADFNIDLGSSWMVGDSLRDVECGRNAGCRVASVGGDSQVAPSVLHYHSLLSFANENISK